MRINKFRGYSTQFTNGNEWFYGSLVKLGNKFYIIEDDERIWDISYDGILVDEKSLGQFTGLHDKNGKEIYEGDILEDSLGRRKVVEYYQDGFWLNASLEGAEWSLRLTHKSSKIIGNIYENPELLKSK